ncbi:MAG TPA: hypothetical protein VGD78_08210 [Chthoniobacterales bacterium]
MHCLLTTLGLSALLLTQLPAAASTAVRPSQPDAPDLPVADPGWPRQFTREGVRAVYYQPQVDDWKNFRELQARVAFTLTPKDGKTVVGIEELRGRTTADVNRRTVLIDDIEIVAVRFPSLNGADAESMEKLLRTTFPGRPMTVSLDRLIASVQTTQQGTKGVPVKTDPPPILVSTDPAILLVVPGKPVLAPIKGLRMQFVLNANWDLFFTPSDSRYYLLADKVWLTAGSLEGPWNVSRTLPPDLSKLPAGENWDHVKKAVAGSAPPGGQVPKVFFAAEPSELIVFAGPPVYKPISGTQLRYANNTSSWVFNDAGDGQIYFLVAGRWFRAPNLGGPWSYAGNDLPEDFSRIPPQSEAAEVLASVPGTPECEDAVLLAQVPTSAVIQVPEAEAKAKVNYNGEPQFAAIEGTPLTYATNANADVIRLEGKYYLCQNAIWFLSSSPTGPWTVAATVPEAIYTIPPSSPVYHVTYVKVESTPRGQVVCSYTSGYTGAYVAGVATGAALVWGTGYAYQPYIYPGPVPVYRPYYATYGVSANYYPNRGVYTVGGYAYGPYGGSGSAAWYNPNTGGYGRAYTEQYPYGGRTNASGYNPSTDTSWTTRQGHNYYGQAGTSTVTRGDQTVQTAHVATNYGHTSVAQGENNLYAGHDGNVYKQNSSGDWTKWDNGQWQPVNTPAATNNRTQSQTGTVGAAQAQTSPLSRQTGGTRTERAGQTGTGTSAGNPQANERRNSRPEGQAPAREENPPSGSQPPGTLTGASTAPASGQTARGQGRMTGAAKGSAPSSSDDQTLNGLNREASARRRGQAGSSQRTPAENARGGRAHATPETRGAPGRRGRSRE